jgi:hypothetical protein
MSEPSLHELERDVEAARARLAADLTTLRSPTTYAEFTETLKDEALDAKDSFVEKARSSVQSTIENFVEDLKAKAAANPTAALAIGAGIAWRLIQRPPIATALVGAGLVSLLRTNARRGIYAPEGYLAAAKDRLKEQASDVAASLKDQAVATGEAVKEKATELAGAASEAVKEKAAELADAAQERAEEWRGQAEAAGRNAATDLQDQARSAKDRASDLANRASDMAGRASDTMGEILNDQETRDKLLLGAAGVAVVAALSIACQRRLSEQLE